jgi:hypothetical protein
VDVRTELVHRGVSQRGLVGRQLSDLHEASMGELPP